MSVTAVKVATYRALASLRTDAGEAGTKLVITNPDLIDSLVFVGRRSVQEKNVLLASAPALICDRVRDPRQRTDPFQRDHSRGELVMRPARSKTFRFPRWYGAP